MARLGLTFAALGIGVLMAVAGAIVGWVVVPNVIDDKIKEQTQLVEGSETWEKWQDVPFPLQLRFYVFNVTNPEALGTGEKLKFEEFGPYIYDETRVKENITIDDENDTVTYRERKRYYFNEEDSFGSEDDRYTVINLPLIAVAHVAQVKYAENPSMLNTAKLLVRTLVNSAKQDLFLRNVSVSELLFQGIKLNPVYNLIPEKPADLQGGLFGLYRLKNDTDDGEYTVKRGVKNHTEFGKIVEWEGKKELEWWYTKGLPLNSSEHYCNKINGSDGSLFPPFVTRDTVLRIYNTDVCRSLYLTFNSETMFKDIPAYKFTIPFEMFAHPICNKDNACFCTKQYDGLAHQCGQSVIRIYGCHEGAPIVTSNARFLDGGDDLFEPIEIPPANRSQHETFLLVEPDSGLLLEASKKVQISVEVQKIAGFQLFQDLDFSALTESPSVIWPVVWAEEHVELDQATLDMLNDKLFKPKKIVNVAKWTVVGVGLAVILVSLVVLIRTYGRK